jgi:hypothetical protein
MSWLLSCTGEVFEKWLTGEAILIYTLKLTRTHVGVQLSILSIFSTPDAKIFLGEWFLAQLTARGFCVPTYSDANFLS